MVITEIFKSIQGESTYAGLPCVFVRLTGCNLRCHWCDTAYAFHGGRQMSLDEVLACVRGYGGKLVEITGGEPLLQPEIIPLTETLIEEGYRVLVETSGERFVGNLPESVVKIVDVKCPASGEGGKFCRENLQVLDGKDQLKFVILTARTTPTRRTFWKSIEIGFAWKRSSCRPSSAGYPPAN
jgi:7-carboxy-7-deazaguanine synthase